MDSEDAPPPNEDSSIEAAASAFGDWLQAEMNNRNWSIQDLATRSGITYAGIWNIVRGNTVAPREETRRRLTAALGVTVPVEVQEAAVAEAREIPGYEWVDFTPSDLETVPDQPGVYVFYDITGRPVYVGKSSKNVRTRVGDHSTRFWFKKPLVVRGAFLSVSDPQMCSTLEMVLIKFLGKHALLNEKGVVRDLDE